MRMNANRAACSRLRGSSHWIRLVFFVVAFCLTTRAYADDYHVYWIGGANASTSGPTFTYVTNSAGLPDYRYGWVTFSWNMAARSTERFDGGGYTLSGGSQSASATCSSDQAGWSGSLTLDFSDRSGPSFGGVTFTVQQNMNGRDSGKGISWSSSKSATASNAGNTLGTPPGVGFDGSTSYYPGQRITGSITGGNNNNYKGYAIFGLTGWTDPRTSVDEAAVITDGSDSQSWDMMVYQNEWGDWKEVQAMYKITVGKLSFTPPTSSASTATVNISWTPSISGGGPYMYRAFCVAGKTPWQTAGWTPSAGDAGQSFQFYVANVQDASRYNGTPCVDAGFEGKVLAIAGPFDVTVVNATDQSQNVTISPTSASVLVNEVVSFSAAGGQNGYQWSGVSSSSGDTASVSYSSVGNYTVSVNSPAGNGFALSNTAQASITVTAGGGPQPPQGQTVSIFPANISVTTGDNVTFSAFGGNNGYNWGGKASGNGNSQTVNFGSAGSYTVTVYSPAGGAYGQSNVAVASITVADAPIVDNASVTISGDQGSHSLRQTPPGK